MSRSIPISRAAKLQARAESPAKPPLLAALTDGEDFELVFTVASKDAVRVLDGWKQSFPDTRLTCIGRIVSRHGLRLRDLLAQVPQFGEQGELFRFEQLPIVHA